MVQYSRHLNKEAGYELTQITDMSKSGMAFTTLHSHAKGELLDMSIPLPDKNESLNVIGKVIHCKEHIQGFDFGYRTSVSFIELSNKTRLSLGETVELLSDKEEDSDLLDMLPEDGINLPGKVLVDRAERVKKGLMFRYRHQNSQELPILNHAVNISGSGVLFRTEKPYEINDTFELDFNLPTFLEPVKVYAKVARCTMLNQTIYDTAVKYDKVSPYFRSAINDTLFSDLKEKENLIQRIQIP